MRRTLTSMRLKPKPRFRIVTLLLLTALIAGGISHFKTWRELVQVRRELTALRNDLVVLDVQDESKLHAIALPTYGPMQWRWRIQLPDEWTYRLRYSLAQIPESGLPANSTRHDQAFLDQYARPIFGSFVFSLGIFKDAKGQWQIKTEVPGRGSTWPIDNPPAWLDAGTFVNWSVNVSGKNETVTADKGGELVLLKYRKGKLVPGGGMTVDMQPTDGMMFWIERIEEP